MAKLNAILFLLFVLLFTNMSFGHQSTINGDGEYWPYPWGTECPFPWDSITSNDWSFDLEDKKVTVSFYVNTFIDSDMMKLTLIAYDEKSRLVAFSSHVYKPSQNILSVSLKDLTSDTERTFSLLVRTYDNRLKVDPSEQFYSYKRAPNQLYCNDIQQRELAVTLADKNRCTGCPTKMFHQIAKKVERN